MRFFFGSGWYNMPEKIDLTYWSTIQAWQSCAWPHMICQRVRLAQRSTQPRQDLHKRQMQNQPLNNRNHEPAASCSCGCWGWWHLETRGHQLWWQSLSGGDIHLQTGNQLFEVIKVWTDTTRAHDFNDRKRREKPKLLFTITPCSWKCPLWKEFLQFMTYKTACDSQQLPGRLSKLD